MNHFNTNNMKAKQLRERLIHQIKMGNPASSEMLLKQYEARLCQEQRELVANELKTWTEDISIPNQYKIDDLCMDTDMPELC